jgi:type I site-specific restriction endonuclease
MRHSSAASCTTDEKPMPRPEEAARNQIDAALTQAGWLVQDAAAVNLFAGRGVAVRDFPLRHGHGVADYLLYVDTQAAGVVEAKKEGETLTGVEAQSSRYSHGLPDNLRAHQRPLPFLYESTGGETRFTNWLDPEPRSRRVFHSHRPDTFADWLAAPPRTLRRLLREMPPVLATGLWPAQLRAVRNLERSLARDWPRALIWMATGSSKTYTAVTAIYHLIEFGARQIGERAARTNSPGAHRYGVRPATPMRAGACPLLSSRGHTAGGGLAGVTTWVPLRAALTSCCSAFSRRRNERCPRCRTASRW